jgi:putative ABC transport system permease protein
MGILWHKIWFDLWNNKMRTLLAVLSIAAGVYAVGVMFGMSDLLLTNMDKSHRAVFPTHVNVILGSPIDRETIISLTSVPGVENVEPYNSVSILYKLHPEDEWRPGVFQMRDDFENQKYELLQLREGHWPNARDEVAVERMAAQFLKVGMGDSVIFKINDKERVLPITGLIRHPFVPPPQFQDLAFFFINNEGMERLGIPINQYGAFYMRVTPYSADYAKEVTSAVKAKLAKQNINVLGFVYEDPEKHWGRAFFDGITLVLKLLALICVVISAVLVYNTLSNLITQQINQIGILKAIGGKAGTIIGMYLFSALVYGILALIIALPLGAITASNLSVSMLGLFNIDVTEFQVSREAIIFQVVSALVAPLLAGLPPVLQGAKITVRQAIASYGLGGDFHTGWFDRVIEAIGRRWLPSHYATALGNMFRRKGRLLLTQLVLIAAGSAFLIVRSLDSSLALTLDNFFTRQDYESMIQFNANERVEPVTALAKRVPGVEEVELRLVQSANMLVSGQLTKEAGIGANIKGVPEGSNFFTPLIVEGRWLAPGETGRVIVISRDTAQKNKIKIGDMVTLDLGILGKDKWQVIGFYEPVFVSNFVSDSFYAPQDALYKATKKFSQGAVLLIRTTSKDGEFTDSVTKQLKALYESKNMKVVDSQTQAALRTTNEWQFSTVTFMLAILSVIIAIVGAIALMGALSIGVIERTKEIGVLRAIGARSHTILGIFVMEGVLQGILSWLIAIPISFIASPAVASSLGHAMFGATLDYQYNWTAVGAWFGLVIIISILASILPARGATRVSVRDSLAYA